jgi:hypothetical protein
VTGQTTSFGVVVVVFVFVVVVFVYFVVVLMATARFRLYGKINKIRLLAN